MLEEHKLSNLFVYFHEISKRDTSWISIIVFLN